MKCLKCEEQALTGKALCEKCFALHEERKQFQGTDEWLQSILDATREQFKVASTLEAKGLKQVVERVALLSIILGLIIYSLVQTRYITASRSQPSGAVQVGVATPSPSPVEVLPAAPPDRTVWVGESNGAARSLMEAIARINEQGTSPDNPWTIRLEPGAMTVDGSIEIPSYTTIAGAGSNQTFIVGRASGGAYTDNDAALFVLNVGSRLEGLSIENEGAGSNNVGVLCSQSTRPSPQFLGAMQNAIRGAVVRVRNPGAQNYGVVNDGCDIVIEQVDLSVGSGNETSQGLLSTSSNSQTSIIGGSVVSEDDDGGCTAADSAGCVGLSVLKGTVSINQTKVRGSLQGASVLEGSLQLLKSEVIGNNRGLAVIQTGSIYSSQSTISSIANGSSGRVVCEQTVRSDGSSYSATCS